MNTTDTHLDEAQIARDAAEFSRRLAALDVHRDDQARADKRRRGEKQELFDERGLPRAKGGWLL